MADENSGTISSAERPGRKELTAVRQRRQRDRAEQFQNLKARCPFGPEEISITALNLTTLLEKLQSRELKAKQVLAAYVAKALDVNEDFNCITEFVPQCFDWADDLDRSEEIKGPLHGVPFCVKDDVDIAGMDSTLGCSVHLYKPKSGTAVIIQALQSLGAVPFCKTNVPQGIIAAPCENPIYGRTLNPLNKRLGPGVSSGGTGCLVAARGSPFGIGTDLGGSVRIPAHFCGVTGLAPTVGRNSSRGITECYKGIAGLTIVPGIIAPSVEASVKIHEALWGNAVQSNLDPSAVPISWNKSIFDSNQALRIGYFTELSLIPSVGDTTATVLAAKTSLESKGHTLIPFELPDALHIYHVYITFRFAEQHNQLRNMLLNDAVLDSLEESPLDRILPAPVKDVMAKLANRYSNERTKTISPDLSIRSSEVLWKYLAESKDLRSSIFERIKELNLDVLLSPAFPFPATNLEILDVNPLHFGIYAYTAIWNTLSFPAGVVPFGKESGKNVEESVESEDPYLQIASKIVKDAKDMPIGVQIIGKPFQEELVLRVLKELEDLRSS